MKFLHDIFNNKLIFNPVIYRKNYTTTKLNYIYIFGYENIHYLCYETSNFNKFFTRDIILINHNNGKLIYNLNKKEFLNLYYYTKIYKFKKVDIDNTFINFGEYEDMISKLVIENKKYIRKRKIYNLYYL